MASWSSRITVTLTMPCTSWTGRSCAGSGWSSNMPGGRGETEMATVGVTGVVGAVSAVYYKIPSLPLPLGVRCRCGLHRELYCCFTLPLMNIFVAQVWCWGTLSRLMNQQPWIPCLCYVFTRALWLRYMRTLIISHNINSGTLVIISCTSMTTWSTPRTRTDLHSPCSWFTV